MLDEPNQKKQESLRQKMLGNERKWRFIQETTDWAAAQPGVSRCTPKARLQHEAKLLRGFNADKT